MPRMIHPDVTDTIDAKDEKVAIYQAQGWVLADQADAEPEGEQVTAVTRASAKKTPAKKTAKKAAKKS